MLTVAEQILAGTVGESILAAIVAAANSVPGLTPIEVEPAGDPDIMPARELYEGGWEPIAQEYNLTRWQMEITVEGYVERSDGLVATRERSALHAVTMAAILEDDTLGGLVEMIELGGLRKSTIRLADVRRLAFSQDLSIQFLTSRTNPALPA